MCFKINKENLKKFLCCIFLCLKLKHSLKNLSKKKESLSDKEFKINFEGNKKEFLSYLYEYYNKEINRKNSIENKGKSILFIITLVITLSLSSLGFIYSKDFIINSAFIFILILILVMGISYYIFAAISLIKVVKTAPISGLYLSERFNIPDITLELLNQNSNELLVNSIEMSIDNQINCLVKYIRINEIIILEKNNWLNYTFELILRGIICIGIFVLLLILIKSVNDYLIQFILSFFVKI